MELPMREHPSSSDQSPYPAGAVRKAMVMDEMRDWINRYLSMGKLDDISHGRKTNNFSRSHPARLSGNRI
jgi:hypothetical protein